MSANFSRILFSYSRRLLLGHGAALLFLCVLSCRRESANVTGPLPQRGYLWQREWTPSVAEAVGEAARHLSGIVLLGAELDVSKNKESRPKIDWPKVKAAGTSVAIALRVSPLSAGFTEHSASEKALHALARSLLSEARGAGVTVAEFQLDYDSPQKRLADYRAWLRRFRQALPGERLVITTLPSWLGEREFAGLVGEVDGYVLQVHSVPAKEAGGRDVLCEPGLARGWIRQAARLGRPFSVALPTYWCLAGYGPDGALLGVAMEGIQPAWPPGTRTFELRADADQLGALVGELQKTRPASLKEIIWYRVPVAGDRRNWRWPTLAAVMSGRGPIHRIEARAEGENPVEIELINMGEADETSCGIVTAVGAVPIASDALPGWSVVQEETRVTFTPIEGFRWRLPPGEKRRIGWIRYEKPTDAAVEITIPPRP